MKPAPRATITPNPTRAEGSGVVAGGRAGLVVNWVMVTAVILPDVALNEVADKALKSDVLFRALKKPMLSVPPVWLINTTRSPPW